MRVARRIARHRLAAGMTQEALAARLQIAARNLQRIESGKQNLTLRTVATIARALELDPETLIGTTPPPGT